MRLDLFPRIGGDLVRTEKGYHTSQGTAGTASPSAFRVAAHCAIALIAWLCLDWLRYGPGAQFQLQGPPGVLWYSLPAALAAWVIRRTSVPRLSVGRSLTVVLAAVPAVLLLHVALTLTSTESAQTRLTATLPWLTGAAVVAALLRHYSRRLQITCLVIALVGISGFVWLDDRAWCPGALLLGGLHSPACRRQHGGSHLGSPRPNFVRLLQRPRPDVLRRGVLSRLPAGRGFTAGGLRQRQGIARGTRAGRGLRAVQTRRSFRRSAGAQVAPARGRGACRSLATWSCAPPAEA